MTTDVVNLRRWKKAAARRQSENVAAANRVAHGVGKQERLAARLVAEKSDGRLDGHRREVPGKGDDA